jgi:hypothetical protein
MGKKVWGYQNFSKKAVKPMKGCPLLVHVFFKNIRPSSKNIQ